MATERTLHIRVDPDEYAKFEAIANSRRMAHTTLLRLLISDFTAGRITIPSLQAPSGEQTA